jgi:predicted permease
MWWGTFGRNSSDPDVNDDVEFSKKVLRVAKFDKILVAVFNLIVSVSPFASFFLGFNALGLTSAVSLSLAVTFGFVTLYAIQTLSSFVSAESSPLLSTMPMTSNDCSLVTLFSFVRSVDYIVLGAALMQVVLVAYLTLSLVATLIMFVASLMNSVFAVSIALWFSRVFRKNNLSGERSNRTTIFRGFFILVWGCLLLGVGLLLSMPYYILPVLDNALFSVNTLSGMLISLVYPFSAGLTIANISGSNIPLATAFLALVALGIYALIAWFSAKWSLATVKLISHGEGVRITRLRAIDFKIKARSPIQGYIIKDLRITSRNPATAFFFALPVLEPLIVAFLATNSEQLRASMVIVATSMGAIFTLLIPLALLTSEGKGIEYAKTLPITAQRMVSSKALITMGAFLPVPFALLCIALLKPLTSWSTILMPFLMISSVVAASVFEILIFLRSVGKTKIAGLVNDAEKIFVGLLTILAPEAAYVIAYLFTFSHEYAILVMGGAAITELGIAIYLLKRK